MNSYEECTQEDGWSLGIYYRLAKKHANSHKIKTILGT